MLCTEELKHSKINYYYVMTGLMDDSSPTLKLSI